LQDPSASPENTTDQYAQEAMPSRNYFIGGSVTDAGFTSFPTISSLVLALSSKMRSLTSFMAKTLQSTDEISFEQKGQMQATTWFTFPVRSHQTRLHGSKYVPEDTNLTHEKRAKIYEEP
jgi:hypothetical protein